MSERQTETATPAGGWRGRLRGFGVVCLVWAGVVAVGVLSSSLRGWAAGDARPLAGSWWPSLLAILFWSLLTAPIMRLGRRFPLERREGRPRALAAHAAAAAAIVAADGALSWAAARWLTGAPPATYGQHVFRYAFINVINYAGVLILQLYLDKRVRAAELETQLARAHLRALQMQLRPHFLFNTLNTVAGLIRSDEKAAATTMLAGLGELLRATLKGDGAHEVPLREELAFVARYLGIEQVRFDNRLEVDVRVAEAAYEALVPTLILQPIVENAVLHGLGRDGGGGRLAIRAERRAAVLRLEVSDTGAPGGPGRAEGGIGLSNTRARLERLYGAAQRFELRRDARGAVATIELPYHTAAGPLP